MRIIIKDSKFSNGFYFYTLEDTFGLMAFFYPDLVGRYDEEKIEIHVAKQGNSIGTFLVIMHELGHWIICTVRGRESRGHRILDDMTRKIGNPLIRFLNKI